mgnify:CR=1 FL=1
MMWTDRRLADLLGIEHPVLQAPMAGISSPAMAVAVSEAGGMGAVAAGMLTPEGLRGELEIVKQGTGRPYNVNFFCHQQPAADAAQEAKWRERLSPYYRELGLAPDAGRDAAARTPFDRAMCDVLLAYKPKVVSFHFGLPEEALLRRVKDAGLLVLSSATTAEEARWLEGKGCDAIIAQGNEAGGHRGMFLTDDIARQAGTMALVPQVVDAVKVPVIAARGIVAALALGAAGVQIGTAFMLSPEAKTSPMHRTALKQANDNSTTLTNVFTGRPARGIINRYIREVGPMRDVGPWFRRAGGAAQQMRTAAEKNGSGEFSSLWSGQAPTFAREMPSGELFARLVEETEIVAKRFA